MFSLFLIRTLLLLFSFLLYSIFCSSSKTTNTENSIKLHMPLISDPSCTLPVVIILVTHHRTLMYFSNHLLGLPVIDPSVPGS